MCEAGYTPTEAVIVGALADCEPHPREELLRLLSDDMAGFATLQSHISNIRRKLPRGQRIYCVVSGYRYCYLHVRPPVPATSSVL